MRRELDRTAQPSLLDRLTDLDPGAGADPRVSFRESVRQVRLGVQRDLEWLLNTRRTPEGAPESLAEVRRSLHEYGLPDLGAFARDASDTRVRVLRHVEEALATFEPRLTDVRVSLAESDDQERGRRELRFLVEATLRMDPTPERVVFDTVLHVSSGEYEVTGASGA